MHDKIKKHLESIFHLLRENEKIIIPKEELIIEWDKIVEEWIDDKSMTLFFRKGGKLRGDKIENEYGRPIVITDNTPAHWVFKNIVLNKIKFTKKDIHKLIKTNEFPIAFARKKTEKDLLIGKMVAGNTINFGDWKLAHINQIGLKRAINISFEDYKKHHQGFLSIRNMYLIDKNFSGLAEVKLFNEIVNENRV
jgi:hypothetical protein